MWTVDTFAVLHYSYYLKDLVVLTVLELFNVAFQCQCVFCFWKSSLQRQAFLPSLSSMKVTYVTLLAWICSYARCQGEKAMDVLQYCRISLVCNKIFLSRCHNISVRSTMSSASLFFCSASLHGH